MLVAVLLSVRSREIASSPIFCVKRFTLEVLTVLLRTEPGLALFLFSVFHFHQQSVSAFNNKCVGV
jgi:hypothetical protein